MESHYLIGEHKMHFGATMRVKSAPPFFCVYKIEVGAADCQIKEGQSKSGLGGAIKQYILELTTLRREITCHFEPCVFQRGRNLLYRNANVHSHFFSSLENVFA